MVEIPDDLALKSWMANVERRLDKLEQGTVAPVVGSATVSIGQTTAHALHANRFIMAEASLDDEPLEWEQDGQAQDFSAEAGASLSEAGESPESSGT